MAPENLVYAAVFAGIALLIGATTLVPALRRRWDASIARRAGLPGLLPELSRWTASRLRWAAGVAVLTVTATVGLVLALRGVGIYLVGATELSPLLSTGPFLGWAIGATVRTARSPRPLSGSRVARTTPPRSVAGYLPTLDRWGTRALALGAAATAVVAVLTTGPDAFNLAGFAPVWTYFFAAELALACLLAFGVAARLIAMRRTTAFSREQLAVDDVLRAKDIRAWGVATTVAAVWAIYANLRRWLDAVGRNLPAWMYDAASVASLVLFAFGLLLLLAYAVWGRKATPA